MEYENDLYICEDCGDTIKGSVKSDWNDNPVCLTCYLNMIEEEKNSIISDFKVCNDFNNNDTNEFKERRKEWVDKVIKYMKSLEM